jgi:hypothetical protein
MEPGQYLKLCPPYQSNSVNTLNKRMAQLEPWKPICTGKRTLVKVIQIRRVMSNCTETQERF